MTKPNYQFHDMHCYIEKSLYSLNERHSITLLNKLKVHTNIKHSNLLNKSYAQHKPVE